MALFNKPLYDFLLVSHCEYILYHFLDKAKYWSKIAIFSFHMHLMPPLRGPCRNSATPFVKKKTRMVWLPGDEKSLRICLAVSTEYRIVTDRQTDRHTYSRLATAQSPLCTSSMPISKIIVYSVH